MEIGKRLEKIPIWWEISLRGRKKVFRCMDHLELWHPSYMRGFLLLSSQCGLWRMGNLKNIYPTNLSGWK
jgi:hypothetical protein